MEKRNYKPLGYKPRPPQAGNLVIGMHPVLELLRSDKEVEKVLINKNLLNLQEGGNVVDACRLRNIPFQAVPVEKLNRVTPKLHQGVIAYVSPISFQQLEHIIPALFEEGKMPFILVLDHITDVRNFGAIARTAECAGVHAIAIPAKGGAQINEDAMKTSAGALNHIPICRENDLGKTLNWLNDNGLTLVACTEKGTDSIYETDMTGPVALIMGSEEDGISDYLIRKAHHLAMLPQQGQIASLNVSVAAGVAMYEVVRQRIVK